jgi:hypothetical protein
MARRDQAPGSKFRRSLLPAVRFPQSAATYYILDTTLPSDHHAPHAVQPSACAHALRFDHARPPRRGSGTVPAPGVHLHLHLRLRMRLRLRLRLHTNVQLKPSHRDIKMAAGYYPTWIPASLLTDCTRGRGVLGAD